MRIETESFGPNADDVNTMMENFAHSENVVVLVKNSEGQIVGFTYTKPAITVYRKEFKKRVRSRKFNFMTENTAYVYNTAFSKKNQHLGLVTLLMADLETTLSERGYEYMDRDSADEPIEGQRETYADKVARNYAGRIVHTYKHFSDYGYGKQRFFRIRLGNPRVKTD